ncbi:MAG: DUF3857 domain-containing protein [Acidobacteriaceae bacterium]
MFRSVALLSVLIVASVASPLQAQSTGTTPFDGAPFTLSAAAMRTASTSIPADKRSDVTILYSEADYRMSAKGTLAYSYRMIYRLETQRALEGWAEISMDWDPWYQNQSQLQARVLRLDGTFSELDPKTVTDAPLDSGEDDTYTLGRVRKAPLPGLAVGSIVEEVVSVDEKRPYFAGGSVFRYTFGNNAPMNHEKLVVELPSSVPFKDHLSNLSTTDVTRSEAGGMRRVVYELDHEPADIYGDIDLASTLSLRPRVDFSTGASWASLAHDYAALAEPHIAPGEVTSLLPSTPAVTRLGLIQQLVSRLHQEVRYTGVEFNESELTPQSPAVVLKRHYGDCKDKATFLVAMLRASKIPADLALLSAGTGPDVDPDLPGMNRFNHAIVYVPATATDPALWIDATANLSAVGNLPFADSNRLALVIAPDTTTLTATPTATSADSKLIETREFTLSEVGPSHVLETSETHGYIDALYRSLYGGTNTTKIKEDLEQYAQSAYAAKGLTSFTHGNGTDLAQPFQLMLNVDGARRGYTSLVDASVAIFPYGILNSLPVWVRTAPVALPDDAPADQKQMRAAEEAQRVASYELSPFTTEQRYRIHVPAGFTARALPADRATKLGPATLTEEYAQESPSLVTATLRFTTDKPQLTLQEALDLRQAVAQVYQREPIMIGFDQTGVKLLSAGRIKQALAADESAIAQNPKSALPHIWLARALVTVGVGGMARAEATRAAELEPDSPAAWATKGWVFENDLLGRFLSPGFDRNAAIAALQKTNAFHSEDFDARFDLAILFEFDANGVRYNSTTLPEAIALYRQLIETEQKKNSSQVPQYRVNLAYALLFHHDYQQLDALLKDIPPGINHATLAIASAVAQKDVAAGIAAADHINVSADDRGKGLVSAGNYLAQLGLYPQSADILSAGIQGQSDAPMVARRIEMYRNLHRVPLASPPVTSAEAVVFAELNTQISGTSDRNALASQLSTRAYPSQAAFELNLDKNMESAGFLHTMAANAGMSEVVLRDLILGGTVIKATGSDAEGYRVLTQLFGQNSHYFVVKEGGQFRIVADGDHDFSEGGFYALYALAHHEPALSKSLLDWKRDLLHKGGGDDPLSGPLLPLFWTEGDTRSGADSPEAQRVAAISLAVGDMSLKPYLDSLVPLRNKATGLDQVNLDLLLAKGYLGAEQPALALPYIQNLLKAQPDSITAISLAGSAYAMNGDQKAWKQLLSVRLARKPTDADLLRQKAFMLTAAHDYASARAAEKSIFDSGQAIDSDYNGYAWLGLFDDHLGNDVTEAAQQANVLSKNGSFADLHTMACVYAAQGKVTEAQQVLKEAMTAGNLSQPNAATWYALGVLYQDYGLREAALAAYHRVDAHEFNDHKFIDAENTYLLAQKGIESLLQPQTTEQSTSEAKK